MKYCYTGILKVRIEISDRQLLRCFFGTMVEDPIAIYSFI